MIQLEQVSEGVVLPVRAQARARKNTIVGEHAGRLKVAVTQAPEKGKANDAIVKVLVAGLSLKRSQFSLLSGATSPQKKFLIEGISLKELRARIDTCLCVARPGQSEGRAE